MEIAIYARVSTQRQQQDQTIEQQLEQLRACLAQKPEWHLAPENIFLDDGCSGAKMTRPGLDRLRERARLAAFSLVLLTAPDRLMRDYTQQILLLDELTRLGCRVAFLDRPASLCESAPSNAGPHEQLVLQIRGAVAEYERGLIGERMRRGRRARLRSGQLLPWTKPPYGYLLDAERPRDPARLQLDPVKAVVVAQIFDWYTQSAPRLTLYQVAQRLNTTQMPTASGQARWQPATIRGILRNPAYTGTAYSERTHNCPAQTRQAALRPVGAGQSSSPTPPEEWIGVAVPALVSAATFALAQARLAENKQMAPRHNTKHEYLLRGLVSCGRCQLACSARWAAPHHPYYACYGRYDAYRTATAERCRARYAPAAALDQLVWQDLCELLAEPARISSAFDRAQAGEWLPQALQARRATLTRTLKQLARQQTSLLDLYLAEVIQRAEFERKRQELAQTQDGLAQQLKELAAQAQQQLDLSLLAAGVEAFCQRLQPTLSQLAFAQRRQLVELLVDRVIVNDGQVEVRYVIPTGPAGEKKRFCHLRKDYFATAPCTASSAKFFFRMMRATTAKRRYKQVRGSFEMAQWSSEDWERLAAIFQAAQPLNAHERRALLDRACAGDEALRREVEALLAAHDRATPDFLQNHVATLGWQVLAEEELRREEMKPSKQELKNRYEIINELSRGGMSTVYLAHDTQVHNRPVAIKVLSQQWRGHAEVVSRFNQETATLANLKDPGIVSIYEMGLLSDGRHWFAMEYVEGETLGQVLRRGKLALADVAEIINQICRTLTTAHEAGVIHRDLKPSNIMLRRATGGAWQVTILDFGIAKVLGSDREATQFPIGTPHYMSPEQRTSAQVAATNDIYALGLIAYEMLTGKQPFETNDLHELAALQQGGVKTKPSELRPDVPKAADDVIAKALAPVPSQRHNTAREFGEALVAALTGAIAEVRIQPYLFAGFLRKPWMTYSVRDGRAYKEGGLFWPSASSISLEHAFVELVFGGIKITKGGVTQKWPNVPKARSVHAALDRVASKGLPLTDLEDDAPSNAASFVGYIICGCLTIAAWLYSLTIPFGIGDKETIRDQVITVLMLAGLGGAVATVFERLSKRLLSSKPRSESFYDGAYVFLAIAVGYWWIVDGNQKVALVTEYGFPSWVVPILLYVVPLLIVIGLPALGMFAANLAIEGLIKQAEGEFDGSWQAFFVFIAWVFGLLSPSIGLLNPYVALNPIIGWFFVFIGFFPLVLHESFGKEKIISDTYTHLLNKWRGMTFLGAFALTYLTMFLFYGSKQFPFIGVCIFVAHTAATLCSVFVMAGFLAKWERRGSFNNLRRWLR